MSLIRYTAKRSIMSGHTLDVVYEFEIDFTRWDRQAKAEKKVARSLGGVTETIFHRQDIFYQITTAPAKTTAIDQMREFLDSVMAGESFVIDRYGSIGSPDNEITMTLEGDYAENRPSIDERFTYTFKTYQL